MERWSPIAKVYDPLKCGSIDGTDTVPHDKGIIRAMNARYKPNEKVVGDPHCTIFVGRLDRDTTEDTLQNFFEHYGKVKRFRLVRDIVTGLSRGYAFFEYERESDARAAYREANKASIDGREIFVDFECERSLPGWIPRRLGGGFGGRKESGQLRFGGRDRPFRKPIITNQPWRSGQRRSLTHLDNYERYSERDTRHDRSSSYRRRSPDRSSRRSSREKSRERAHPTSRSPRDKRNKHHGGGGEHKHRHKHKHKHRHDRQ